jgi:SnoaL-like domain
MANWKKVLTATTVACGVLAIAAAQAQQRRVWSLGHLTPRDYIEIQQLVAHYPYALDRGTDHGRVYAALFTPNGVFQGNGKNLRGRDELAKSADRGEDAPQNVGHFMMNHVIEPGPNGGAVGKQYLLTISAFGPEENGRRAVSIRQWHYEDVYEKTSEGWLFKSRTLIEKPKGRPPVPQVTPSR